jgi:hypothetical protein
MNWTGNLLTDGHFPAGTSATAFSRFDGSMQMQNTCHIQIDGHGMAAAQLKSKPTRTSL